MTKVEQAAVIFKEVNGVRADFIKRVVAELGMGQSGASTYFQNEKKRSKGEKVVNYRPKANKVQQGEDDKETFGVALKDGHLKVFGSQQERDDFIAQNAELIAEDQGEEA